MVVGQMMFWSKVKIFKDFSVKLTRIGFHVFLAINIINTINLALAMVLDHFTKKSFHRIFWPKGHLTETPFDRTPFDRIPFDRKNIWPNRRLIESHLNKCSFYRKKSFGQKQNLSKGRLTENIWKMFIWPEI
jgi:hypothetical protein